MRVAVLRFSAVGDVVLTLPAMRALRAAGAEVWLVTRAPLHALFSGEPWIHPLPLAPGEGAIPLAARLRRIAPDQLLDLHGSLRARALAALLPEIPVIRWQKRPPHEAPLARLGLRRPRASGRVEDRMLSAARTLIRACADPPDPGPDPAPPLRPDPDRAARWRARIPPGAIALCPGAGHPTKEWPIRRWIALADRLRAAGTPLVVTGGPGERDRCAPLLDPAARAGGACGAEIVDAVGAPLEDLPALLAACRAVVANDSGPMHLGRALGLPTVALFGPTDPGMFDLCSPRRAPGPTALIRRDPGCAPCSFFGGPRCPLGHHRCMEEIAEEEVLSALAALPQPVYSPP